MSKIQRLKFRCPECGADHLKSVEKADIVQVSRKIEIEDGEVYLVDAETDINPDGENIYSCGKCGENIGDGTELRKYLYEKRD